MCPVRSSPAVVVLRIRILQLDPSRARSKRRACRGTKIGEGTSSSTPPLRSRRRRTTLTPRLSTRVHQILRIRRRYILLRRVIDRPTRARGRCWHPRRLVRRRRLWLHIPRHSPRRDEMHGCGVPTLLPTTTFSSPRAPPSQRPYDSRLHTQHPQAGEFDL